MTHVSTRRGPSEVKLRPSVVRAVRREQRLLGLRLRRLRLARSLTLELAAEQMGLSMKQLGRIERGTANVTLATLVAIALGLRASLGDFFREDDEE